MMISSQSSPNHFQVVGETSYYRAHSLQRRSKPCLSTRASFDSSELRDSSNCSTEAKPSKCSCSRLSNRSKLFHTLVHSFSYSSSSTPFLACIFFRIYLKSKKMSHGTKLTEIITSARFLPHSKYFFGVLLEKIGLILCTRVLPVLCVTSQSTRRCLIKREILVAVTSLGSISSVSSSIVPSSCWTSLWL